MDIILEGKKVRLDDRNSVSGGEAKVFFLRDLAVKIYHPEILTPMRIEKLRQFPKNLPDKVISPQSLVEDLRGNVIGFAMKKISGAEPFLMLANLRFRANFPDSEVKKLFLDARETLAAVHLKQAVIGDLNSLNVMFAGDDALFIDADSIQFSRFPCEVAMERFLDPLLYGADYSRLAFTPGSDWYSFATMLFESLLFVHPFGGVHPKYPTLERRAKSGLTIMDPTVKYPKAARRFDILPDSLLEYFHGVFEKGERAMIPRQLIADLNWTVCQTCGNIHARSVCPSCVGKGPERQTLIVVNRKCSAKSVMKTRGRIILATVQNGGLRTIVEEKGKVMRENGEIILDANPDNFTRFAIMGKKTLIGRGEKLVVTENGKVLQVETTGMLGNLPVFETDGADYFRLHGDQLVKGENMIIGQIISGQTWIRSGPDRGFGFYRIGRKTVYFIFDTARAGLNDDIRLPTIAGKLIDAEALFSQNHILFMYSAEEKGRIMNSMYLLDDQGNVIASLKEEAGQSRMISGIHNKALSGSRILVATDAGLMLVEAAGGTFQEVKMFSETEPFVNENVQLLPAPDGIYVVATQEMKLLKLL